MSVDDARAGDVPPVDVVPPVNVAAEPPIEFPDPGSEAPFVDLPDEKPALVMLAVALFVALGEVSRLSGDVLDTQGRSWPFSKLMGPGLDFHATGWQVGLPPDHASGLMSLLIVYVAMDVLFIGVYLGIANVSLDIAAHPELSAIRGLVYVLVAVDLFEDLVALLVMWRRLSDPLPGWVAQGLVLISTAKWLLVVAVVALLLRVLLTTPLGRSWRAALRRQGKALYVHRFSVLAILPVTVLSVVPGPNLFDQLPDAERQWLDDKWVGLRFVGFATLALALLVLALFFLGRWRSDQAWQESAKPADFVEERKPNLWLWLVGPGLLGILAVIVWLLLDGSPQWRRLVIFCAVPLVVAGISLWRRYWSPPVPPAVRQRPVQTLKTVIRVGDGIAVLALSLASIGLVRSFAAPFALLFKPWGGSDDAVLVWVAILGGLSFAALPWILQAPVRRWLHKLGTDVDAAGGLSFVKNRLTPVARMAAPGVDAPLGPAAPEPKHLLRLSMLGGSLAVIFLLGFLPVWMAHYAGFLACAVLAVASIVVMVGVTVAYVRDSPPPEVFRSFGLQLHSAPILTLFVLAIFLASFAHGEVNVHGLRGLTTDSAAAHSAPRIDMATAFDRWLTQPNPCRLMVTVNGHKVGLRPMLMVAGEGGGIRATYWTALGMEQIGLQQAGSDAGGTDGKPSCGAGATLFSGGASGGAVGLGVSRFTRHPVEDVTKMAQPDALGAGAIGLFIRDVLDAAAGVPLPAYGGHPGYDSDLGIPSGAWLDRAGLMETVWQSQSRGLRNDYLPAVADRGSVRKGLTGQLILSSTSVAGGCRVFVSQVRLPGSVAPPLDETHDPNCSAANGPAPYSFDLFANYGPSQDPLRKTSTGDHCLGNPKASTASMLASRFPYVTPSGVVGPCGRWSSQQLVDGGYTENSGLGTIIDLAPVWQPLVRAQNESVVRWASSSSVAAPTTTDFVFPVVVFLDNGIGNDVRPPTQSFTSELQVPLAAISRAGKAQKEVPALLQRASALVDTRLLCDQEATAEPAACATLSHNLEGWAPRRVDVVRPATTPSITAPLGWVLSDASEKTMREAMAAQAEAVCFSDTADAGSCANGYGSLKDVLQLLVNGG